MFISFGFFDASLVWRRFLHSLGRVSSPRQTYRLHTNRDRSSPVIESIIYDIHSIKTITVQLAKIFSQYGQILSFKKLLRYMPPNVITLGQ